MVRSAPASSVCVDALHSDGHPCIRSSLAEVTSTSSPPERSDSAAVSGPPAEDGARIGVVALVPDRWRGIWMPRHQVLHRLGRHFEVVWVEAARPWREYWGLRRRGEEVIQNVAPDYPGCTVYDSGRWLPEVYRPHWLRNLIRRTRVKVALRMLRMKGCSQIVLYVWRPEFAWALEAFRADLTCYHIDDEYAFSTAEQQNDPAEIELIRRVDTVFIHSRRLQQKKGGINRNSHYMPNGVDYRAYSAETREPADLASIPRPRMGYVGVVKTQLDLELLCNLAERRPQWSFVLVGPKGFLGEKAPQLERLSRFANVYLLGNRPIQQLPAYVQAMDVCMMCYELTDYTNFIYPLKLHEYLASGRPVVTTPIDTVIPFGEVVRLARTPAEWEQALADGLAPEANTPEAVAARRACAAAHDWDLLVDQIAAQMRAGLGAAGSSNGDSVAGLGS